jgi:putative thioredoxin
MATATNVIEVTDQTFQRDVLEESFRRPVVVDFWAGWCQPCRLIGPVLERLADEQGGEFLLAKLDVDANPQASTAFRIQSIPAVKAFRDGRLVNEFVGAIPEQSIRQWLGGVLPTEADRLAIEGEDLERSAQDMGDPSLLEQADARYRQALAQDPKHRLATLGVGRILAQRGEFDRAREALAPLRPDPEAERILAAIEVSAWASPNGDGPLADAERAAAEGRYRDALEVFLAAVRNGDQQDRDRAREAMLKLFSVLGDDDALTDEYRRKLAAALF